MRFAPALLLSSAIENSISTFQVKTAKKKVRLLLDCYGLFAEISQIIRNFRLASFYFYKNFLFFFCGFILYFYLLLDIGAIIRCCKHRTELSCRL